MPVYHHKQWFDGDSPEDNGEPLSEKMQEKFGKPLYRPGWIVKYRMATTGKTRIGKILYAFRELPHRLTFYEVVRLKNDKPDITIDAAILERVQNDS
jgi:hypothetical protein